MAPTRKQADGLPMEIETTLQKSPIKKIVITQRQKQALIDNLQLESELHLSVMIVADPSSHGTRSKTTCAICSSSPESEK